MANDSRPGRKIKNDENNNAPQKELRRSTRESPLSSSSKKQTSSIPSSLNNRKSERLEKQVPNTPADTKKSVETVEILEKTPTPLRRSDRSKKQIQENGVLDVKNKKGEDMMKIAKGLNFESIKVNQSEREEQPIFSGKRKRMDSRSYKAQFKKQSRRKIAADNDDVAQLSTLPVIDLSSGGTSDADDVDDCSEQIGEDLREESFGNSPEGALRRSQSSLRDSNKDKMVQNVEVELSFSSWKHNEVKVSDGYGVKIAKDKNTLDNDETVALDCSNEDTLGAPDSDETCNACFKRQRVDHDSENENLCSCNVVNKGLCDTSNSEDRGELDGKRVSIIQGNNKTPLDCQSNVDETKCVVCMRGGKLRCCDGKGCKRSYHISCLNPPLHDEPLGIWHCIQCVIKKIQKGVHSVSKGVESIWDFREVEVSVSDTQGCQKQKQYFVKYEGLAHLHNKWVPESELLLEAPLLVTTFKLKDQAVKWNADWVVPHKLLKKRLLFPLDEHIGETLRCRYEWLVKWRGLDYGHASWELENSPFLKSAESQRLVREYEQRLQRALDAVLSDKSEMEPITQLSKLPAGCQPEIDNASLSIVSKLGDYWRKGKSAVVFDEQVKLSVSKESKILQERATRIIYCILSFSNISKPFLVITTSNSLSHWEAEFMRLAPSIDALVYSGNKDNRKSMRTLEFYEEGGRIMFQVLLSSIEAVVEDLKMLQTLKWEAIIVDECQCPIISRYFEQLKKLPTDSKVLIFGAPIKESITDYQNLLSVLDNRVDSVHNDVSKTESDGNLGKLKERMDEYIAYKCNFSMFLEYWLPVQISNLQLEQYCYTLLSNAIALCSCLKNDPLLAVRDTLISSLKCCDHPYLVNDTIQESIIKDLQPVEYLNVGIKASGKLQLLDEILSELKKRHLRVLILYKSIGGAGKDLMGAILDDFLRQRFGQDSYEGINSLVRPARPPKKHEAVNRFNNKENNRFVFLIESRACHSSVKLCSIDSIVIFNSDFTPFNDIRSLQKMSIDSQFQQIKVFRLYSSCTIEEKILIHAKQNLALDEKLSSTLLMWGASYLFDALDKFHSSNVANIESEPSVLKSVVKEFVDIISQNDEINETSKPLIVQVQHGNRGYRTSLELLGEKKIQLAERDKPHVFWTKLLEGRHPRGKFMSAQNQRQRKRVQHFTDLPEKQGGENDEVGKKQKKARLPKFFDGSNADNGPHSLPKSVANFTDTIDVGLASELFISDNRSHADSSKSLHLLLKPDLLRLCEILKLSEDVKVMVGKFLEYVVENHQVNREPESIFQAFQISMCWIAASLLKHKIDREESIALAKNHLQFICKEEEAVSVYSRLKLLKKDFVFRNPNLTTGTSSVQLSESQPSIPKDVKAEVVKKLLTEEILSDLIKPVKKICEKRMAKLVQNQQDEIREFNKSWDNKILDLENKHKLEAALVRAIHHYNVSALRDKLKGLDEELKKKMDELQQKKDTYLKDLEAKHLKERIDEKYKAANWLAKAKSSASGAVENVEKTPPPGTAENVLDGEDNVDETGTVDLETNRETANIDEADSSNYGDSPSMVDPLLVQPAVTSESPLSHDLESQSDQSQPLDSTGVRDGSPPPATQPNQSSVTPADIPPPENVDGGPISPPEPPIVESLEPLRTTSPPIDRNPPDIPPACGSQNIANLSSGSGPTTTGLQGPARSQIESTPDLQPPTPSHSVTDSLPVSGPIPSHPAGGPTVSHTVADLPPSSGATPSQNVASLSPVGGTTVSHNVSNIPPASRRTPSRSPGDDMATNEALFNQGTNHHPRLQSEHQADTRVTSIPSYADPLQNELDRIRRETEQIIKAHEDTKSKLKNEYEKEIEEMIAQIRRKYEVKFKDAEGAFLLKKKELDDNQNKVVMNKKLADAFRSKCLDVTRYTAAATSSFMQQLRQLTVPSAPRALAGPPSATQSSALSTPRSSTVNNSPGGPPPAATQLAVPSAPLSSAVNSSSLCPLSAARTLAVRGPPVGPQLAVSSPAAPRVPALASTSTAIPLATPQVSVPPLQVVSESAALFSTAPTRPLPVTSITPSTGNHRAGGGEIRAPAPHLQPFRPPPVSAPSVATLLRAMPGPHIPRPPPPSPPPQFQNPHTPVSAMEFLMDVDRRHNPFILNSLPPLPDIDSNFAPLDLSEFGPMITAEVSSAPPFVGTDNIVCLSDEE